MLFRSLQHKSLLVPGDMNTPTVLHPVVLEERFELSFSFEKKILSLPRIPIPPFELVEDNRVELFSGVYKTHALTDKLILYKIYFKQKNKKSKYFWRYKSDSN